MSKRIVVFGATGGTGKSFVEQALESGHSVTAFVREPAAFRISHKNLRTVKGDVFHVAGLENVTREKDVVVSCLGTQERKPTTIYSTGTTNIMKAMNNAKVSRLICLSSAGVEVPPDASRLTRFMYKNILHRIFKHLYVDMLLMERLVAESNSNWTIVRPARLTDEAKTGKYRMAVNDRLANPSKISRADLADFIVKHLLDEKTYKSCVEIAY